MDRTGQVLNERYHVERTLGRGGMGAVYLARQSEMGNYVAIKEMVVAQIEPMLREACVHQFRAEARILNRLRHPGLPRVYDYFEQEENQFLVMDYIEGGTLNDHAARIQADEAQVLEWVRQLCDVLEYLHNHNPPVVFKDVKPTNVMLAQDGTLRLIDFGIAKVFDPTRGDNTATVLKGSGSDGFAPIEQYGQGKTDNRSDIYGLGATLYCLLTKRVPPSAPDRAGGDDPMVPLTRLRPDLSERLVGAVEWMLQVNREARPRSISEVVDALGLTPALGVPRTTLPARIRRLMREEFHHFFPGAVWFSRTAVPLADLAAFLTSPSGDQMPAPMVATWGDAGCGKTRLISELRILVKDAIDVIPPVQGSLLLRHQPFGCLIPAIRTLLRRKSGAMLSALAEALDSQILFEASSALPELRTVTPGGPHLRRSSAEMTRSLLVLLTAIFHHASTDRPALLIVDDAQWADPATMRFLDQLRGGPVGSRIPILMAWQPDSHDEPHRDFVETWNREGETAMIPCPPLGLEELRAYLKYLVPPISDVDILIPDLFELSAGNPLLLEELVRLMVARRILREGHGKLRVDDWRPEHMPRTLAETVRRRLEHLPLDSQIFLAQASAVGMTFNVDTLREISGEPEPIVREALQRAREACFIRVSADTPNAFDFISAATRDVFYERLSKVDRARIHRTLAILEEDRSAITGEISHAELHFAMAGDLDNTLEDLSRITQDFLSPRHLEVVLGEMPQVKTWDKTSALTPAQESAALDVLHLMSRAVRSKDSFGSQTYVTEMAQESFVSRLLPLLDEVGPLTINCSENVYSINGRSLTQSLAQGDLLLLLARHRLGGFQMRPGLTRVELFEWVNILVRSRDSIQEEGGWTQTLARHGVEHVTVSEMIFVGVPETELFDPSRIKDFGTITIRDSKPGSPGLSLENAPAGRRGELEGRPPSLQNLEQLIDGVAGERVDEVAVMARLDAIRAMLEELKKASAQPEPERPKVVEAPTEPLPPPEVIELARELHAKANPRGTARLLAMVRSAETPLVEMQHRTPELLLHDLESGDANQQVAAVTFLQALGKQAVSALLGYLSHSDHARARASALHVLRRVANDAEVILTRRLVESSSAEESCRLLGALESGSMPWTSPLSVLLHSPSPEVRRHAYAFFQKSGLSNAEKGRLLGDIIKSDHPGLIADASRAAGYLRLVSLVPLLLNTLRRTFDKSADTVMVQREACYALGRIGQADVLPKLTSIVFPGLTQMKRDPEVRSAALWAVGRLPGEDADELLERAIMDRDPLLRAMARVAMETRKSTTTDPEVLAQLEY